MLKERFSQIEGMNFPQDMKDALTVYARLRKLSPAVRGKLQAILEDIPLIKPLSGEEIRFYSHLDDYD